MAVPSVILRGFFEEATEALKEVTLSCPEDVSSNITVDTTTATRSSNLDTHRQRILRIQVEILQRVIHDYNAQHDASFDMDEAQRALREMGISSNDNTDDDDNTSTLTEELMCEMNEMARFAFTRLVLQQQWEKTDDASLSQDEPMSDSDVKEFCALCATAVSLPEVLTYLKNGTSPVVVVMEETNSAEKEDGADDTTDTVVSFSIAQERLTCLQNAFYRAIGQNPTFGSSELRRMLQSLEDGEESDERKDALRRFITAMSVTMNQITQNSENDKALLLSDTEDGGCTRVVSVTHSETTTIDNTNTHNSNVMEEHVDDQQRKQLIMARQAAGLQQDILGELLTLSETDRDEALHTAKQAHDDFMEEVTKLPISGPERLKFLQTTDQTTQRLLVMHKLWQTMLEQNNGEAPRDRRNVE